MSPVNAGERIRQLCLGLGMSVRALATKAGFSPSLISQVEHNQVTPSIGSLERIAMALGASARQKLTSTWSPVSIKALGPLAERSLLSFLREVTLMLGDEGYVRRQGDAITFPPATPQQWDNIGAGPAQVVLVTMRMLP